MLREFQFTTSGSSGPGGQNVNKVNTKVTLRWDVRASENLSEKQKAIILKKLASRINKEGVFILSSDAFRSQLKNKTAVLERFDELMRKAFYHRKKRKPTRPSKGVVEKRIRKKKLLAEKKERRRKLDGNG